MGLPQISNLATRFLSDELSPTAPLPPSALDDAKANLRGFALVGIQERFAESVVLLQRMLGVGPVSYLNAHMSGPRAASIARPAVEDIPEEQRALILEHNRLDVELYAFALQLFERSVAAAGPEFAGDVRELEGLVAEKDENATRQVREWFDRELPPGTVRPRDELYASAAAAGVSRQAIKHAFASLSITIDLDEGGQPVWIR
jgi:hypothetical protein